MNIKIKFGVGLGQIFFGMVPSEVISILGNPDKINDDEREGCVVYYYNELMTRLFFDLENNNRLITIFVSNPDAYVWNQKIIGMRKTDFESLLDKNKIPSRIYDDYKIFDSIFCEEIWSVFGFQYDKLTDIEFSVLADEHNDCIWAGLWQGRKTLQGKDRKMSEITVKPGIGLGNIKFGITESELAQLLGEPDKIIIDEAFSAPVYFYNDRMTQFMFDPAMRNESDTENRLDTITTSNPEVYLWNTVIIGKSSKEIEALLQMNHVTSIEYEDYGSSLVMYCEDISMEFTFEFDRVNEICFYIRFENDNNTIKWPN
ncbi:MAG: hypothetical protein ACI4D3_00470 [Lachnospiraceae bacterium]